MLTAPSDVVAQLRELGYRVEDDAQALEATERCYGFSRYESLALLFGPPPGGDRPGA